MLLKSVNICRNYSHMNKVGVFFWDTVYISPIAEILGKGAVAPFVSPLGIDAHTHQLARRDVQLGSPLL